MKFFMILLALKLTAAEKLNRRYLPPPGAKFSGGRSDDLQTPLEYPKSGYGGIAYNADDSDSIKIGPPDKLEFSSMATKGPYYESLSHLRNDFDKPIGNIGFGVDNTGNMLIALPESIGQNYQSHLFGMYGGKPMSINYDNNNIEVDGSDNLLSSDEKIRNPQAVQYLPTTSRPNKDSVTTLELGGQNLSFKKFGGPQANTERSAIVRNYENVLNQDGYFYRFDTSNEIYRNESASTSKGFKTKGSYSYKGDDGKVYTVTYTADENGFQPSGDHLPVIPEAIQNVIEQAQKDKDAGIIDKGFYDETKYGHMKYQGPVHRYMQKNAKIHKRLKITGEQKTLPSKIKKYETNNIINNSTENWQPKQNKNRKPPGMRRAQVFYNRRNEKDDRSDYSQKVNNNKIVSKSMVLQNIQRNSGILNSNTEKRLKIPVVHDGYFYVPPKNIFVDGKYQDKLFTDVNINNSSVLETKFNTDEQRNETDFSDKDLPRMTQFISSTQKPFYQQTYDGDFNESTNDNMDQLNDNTRKTASPSKKSDTETSEQLYGNSFITKLYDNEFTREIVQKKETVIPENRFETDILSSQNDFDTENYQSTTPLSSEARYTIQTYENINQYETTLSESALTSSNFDLNYFENEGYFKTTPEEPATLRDFSSSTYNPYTYTTEETVGTDSTTHVKVDEFGRTSQDSFSYSTDSFNDSFTNGMQSDTESKTSLPYNDNEETLRTDKPKTLDDKSITQFPNEFGSEVNKTPEDFQLGTDAIIGEDFSGPKQPQRYDPKQGYYY